VAAAGYLYNCAAHFHKYEVDLVAELPGDSEAGDVFLGFSIDDVP